MSTMSHEPMHPPMSSWCSSKWRKSSQGPWQPNIDKFGQKNLAKNQHGWQQTCKNHNWLVVLDHLKHLVVKFIPNGLKKKIEKQNKI